ncbi:hypothetical protein OVY01_11430 [Robbsia sp. Bb-Pol-6]|uniref:Uncharacterized protein n=1 Tax=Robbsia betulipollinis TaxID=2981849 RepID=A0ABT3ZMR6_9BURK|nr:hypothetical protein [Robbsia betulipollinis]
MLETNRPLQDNIHDRHERALAGGKAACCGIHADNVIRAGDALSHAMPPGVKWNRMSDGADMGIRFPPTVAIAATF